MKRKLNLIFGVLLVVIGGQFIGVIVVLAAFRLHLIAYASIVVLMLCLGFGVHLLRKADE